MNEIKAPLTNPVWIVAAAEDAESIEMGSYWPPADSPGYFAVPGGDLEPIQRYADKYGPSLRLAIIEADVPGAIVTVNMKGVIASGCGVWGQWPITCDKERLMCAIVSPEQMRQAKGVRIVQRIEGRAHGGGREKGGTSKEE